MIKFLYKSILLISLFSTFIASAEHKIKLKKKHWPFDGGLGKVDLPAAQRGFQIYKEVCSACHGLYHLSYRNLKSLGFSDAEVKEIAKNYTVKDGPNDDGEMFDRPATPADLFVKPFANEAAARSANGGAYPPDLSLIIKAREDGANYVYSLLNGYTNPEAGIKVAQGLYYNKYFPSYQIAMPPPLHDGAVTYSDGTKASLEQMASDVTIFLQWAAEPEMQSRKSMGLKAMLFLVVFTILFYLSKKRIWRDVK